MTKKRITELIDINKDLIKSNESVIAIYGGTSAGKTTLIEGCHNNDIDFKGLVDMCRVDICTSRKPKVNESLKKNDEFLSHMNELGAAITCKGFSFNVIHTNAHIHKYLQEHYRKDNELTYFWRKFDFIVIDEFHSLCADSSFANCTYTVMRLVDKIIEDKALNNIKTKVILLSATPESVEWLAERWKAKVYDFRGCTPYIKPKSIEVTNYLLAERNITQKVKDGQTVVYYCSHLNKLFPLIKEALANGIAEKHIAVDIADASTLEKLEDKYPNIFQNSKQLEETLSSQEIIDSQFKLILTNSKCKEAININSKVDLLVIESHYITDIIQICGRFRSGIDKAYIIENAHQFQCFDDFYDEKGYYSNRIEFDNKELERRTFDAPQGAIYYPIHHNRDTLQYINKIICQSHYETYNLFTEKFEVDELYVHFKEHYTTSVKVLETLLSNRQQFSTAYPYFEGITISYSSGIIEEGYIETIFEERGWTIGETKLSYDEFVEFCNLLKEKYISLSSSKKKYKNNKPILNFFGLDYKTEGHKGSKEKSKYIISKLPKKDSE